MIYWMKGDYEDKKLIVDSFMGFPADGADENHGNTKARRGTKFKR